MSIFKTFNWNIEILSLKRYKWGIQYFIDNQKPTGALYATSSSAHAPVWEMGDIKT